MTHSIVFRPEAEQDLRASYDWYEEQHQGLGDDFIAVVETHWNSITVGTSFWAGQCDSRLPESGARTIVKRIPRELLERRSCRTKVGMPVCVGSLIRQIQLVAVVVHRLVVVKAEKLRGASLDATGLFPSSTEIVLPHLVQHFLQVECLV